MNTHSLTHSLTHSRANSFSFLEKKQVFKGAEKFFGEDVVDQDKYKPHNWLSHHDYWNNISDANKDNLNNLKAKIQNRSEKLNFTEVSEYTVKRGDSLSKILKDEAKLTGTKLLMALVHLQQSGVDIDRLNVGETVDIFGNDNKNLSLHIYKKNGRMRVNELMFPEV